MKRKLLGGTGLVLALIAAFCVWEKSTAKTSEVSSEITGRDLEKSTAKTSEVSLKVTGRDWGSFVYLDGKILTYTTDPEDVFVLRMIQIDPETGAETEMKGTVYDFDNRAGGGEVLDGKYYECFTDEAGSRVLYEFDTKRGTVAPVSSIQKDVSPFMWNCVVSNGILQLRAPRVETGEAPYIDLYCPVTGETKTVLRGSYVDSFIQIAADQDLLYVLSSHYDDPNRSSMFTIQVFETDGYRMVSEINVDAMESMLQTARTGDMVVRDGYVFFENWADQGVLAKISDGVATPILERDCMKCAEWFNRPEQMKQMLFYEHKEEGECFVLDLNTGELRSFQPKLRRGYDLGWIQIDQNRVMMYSYNGESGLIDHLNGIDCREFLDFFDYSDFVADADLWTPNDYDEEKRDVSVVWADGAPTITAVEP